MFRYLYKYAAVAPSNSATESTGEEVSTHSDSTDEIDLKGDQFHAMSDSRVNLTVWDIWALGLTTAIGGHFYLWSACLVAGFGSFLIATVLISIGFGTLILCMAELAGALPFAGGAYGVTRVTMGSYPGFLVACCDAYQSMFYTALSVFVLGALINYIGELDKEWIPVWWLLIYISYVAVHAWGGPTYWRIMKTLSIGSLLILVMYILGCIKYADFKENAPVHVYNAETKQIEDVWFKGGIDLFLKILPIPCWFYVGIESLNLAAHETENPKRDIPRGYVSSYLTTVITTLATIFVAVSVFPGSTYLPLSISPQSWTFAVMFDINYQRAAALALPPIYTSGFGFTYYYSSQVRAMGKSGLAPAWLGYDIPHRNTPLNALVFGAVAGFLMALRYYFWEAVAHESLFSVSLQGAVIVYCSQFISFIMFRLYYPTIKREFVSPLGIPGAVLGMAIFLLVFIVIAGLENSPGIIGFAAFIGVLTIYYFLVVVHRQVFSEEEKTVLFKAYLMKSNRTKAARVRTGRSHGGFHAVHRYALSFFGRTPATPEHRKKPSPRHMIDPGSKGGVRNSRDRTESAGTERLYGGATTGGAVAINLEAVARSMHASAGAGGAHSDHSGHGGIELVSSGVAYPHQATTVPLESRSSDKTETTISVRYKISHTEPALKEQSKTNTATMTTTADDEDVESGGSRARVAGLYSAEEAAHNFYEAIQHGESFVETDVQLRDMHMHRPGDPDEGGSVGGSRKNVRFHAADDLV